MAWKISLDACPAHRGGKIIKARISYDKETVKRYVDKEIMKIKEK